MREKGSPSRRIGVFRFVFNFLLLSLHFFFLLEGNTLRGAWGTAGRENGDGRLPGFWEVGTWRTGYASTSYAFLLFFFHLSTWTRTAKISNPT